MISLRHAAAVTVIMMAGAAPTLAAAKLSSADSSFANKAAMSGLAEVQAAQLAEQKASSPDVKQFAAQMVTDHTKANTELTQLASGEGITLPTGPDARHVATMHRLEQISGTQFDQQYMKDQVADHKTAVALFRREASSGRDPQLKAYAQKYLPVLQHHLQMAETINSGA